jgi:dissimilatory sulfite reductase related protein
MSELQVAGRTIALNKRGHLANFDDWNREIAQAIAEDEGLALGNCHWKVIEFLRRYYAANQFPPPPRVVVRDLGHELSEHVACTRKQLETMFPNGGCRQACRIAGLPDYYCHGC